MATQHLPALVTVQISTVVSAWTRTTALTTHQSYQKAITDLDLLRTQRKTIKDHFARRKRGLNDTRRLLIDEERQSLDDIAPTEEKLNAMIMWYEDKRREQAQKDAREALKHPEKASLVRVSDDRSQPRRSAWCAVVDDLTALVKAVAEGRVPPEAVMPCMPALNRMARQQKAFFSVPGVSVEVKEYLVKDRSS